MYGRRRKLDELVHGFCNRVSTLERKRQLLEKSSVLKDQ